MNAYSEKTYDVSAENSIIVADQLSFRAGVQLDNQNVVADADGKKFIKAGTPVGSAVDPLLTRTTVVTKCVTSEGAVSPIPRGLIYKTVDVTTGTVDAVLITEGVIDFAKIDTDTQALITDAVKNALPKIRFINGRKD